MFGSLLSWTQETLAPLGALGLFILAVIESIFFPIPVDVLLIILALSQPENWLLYALIATAGSVIGAAIGYRIGYWGEKAVLRKICPEKYIRLVHDYFQRYESLAIFIAGFTPIPYKVFAVGAGVFYVRFWPFIFVSIIARGLRFLLVAFFASWYMSTAATPLLNAIMVFGVLLAALLWVGNRIF